jgi:hypothetical protein
LELKRIFENKRIGITIRELRNLSVSDIEDALSYIKEEFDSPVIDIEKKVIKEFSYNKERNEYFLFAIIDVPMKVKELVLEKGEYLIKDRYANFARNINVIIQLDSSNIIILSQSQREIQRFSKYLREITSGSFFPVSVKFKQENLHNIIREFDDVYHLKFSKNGNKSALITFRGYDLLSDGLVTNILSNDDYSIHEIGGYLPLSSGDLLKSYLNYKGRMLIFSDPDKLKTDDLFILIKTLEKMKEKR